MEDDGELGSPQFWVERTLAHGQEAQVMNVDGFLAMTWRTKESSLQIQVVAALPWAGQDAEATGLTALQIYRDLAQFDFGLEETDALRLAAILLSVDSFSGPHQHALSRSTVSAAHPKIDSWAGGGCNNYIPNPVTANWTLLAPQFRYVDQILAFAPKVRGAANMERFRYWADVHQLNRAEGKAMTLWAAFENAFSVASNSSLASAGTRRAALSARVELVAATDDVMRLHSDTLGSMGSLGTLMEKQQRWIPFMISNYDASLAKVLQLPVLPPAALLSPRFLGVERVFALSARGSMAATEPSYVLTAIALSAEPVQICAVFAQPLGPSTAPMFLTQPMSLLTAGRQVFRLEVKPVGDFQFYVNCSVGARTLTWPADGVKKPFTVIVV